MKISERLAAARRMQIYSQGYGDTMEKISKRYGGRRLLLRERQIYDAGKKAAAGGLPFMSSYRDFVQSGGDPASVARRVVEVKTEGDGPPTAAEYEAANVEHDAANPDDVDHSEHDEALDWLVQDEADHDEADDDAADHDDADDDEADHDEANPCDADDYDDADFDDADAA